MARQRDTCWLAKQVGIGGRGGAVPTYRLPAPEPGNQADQMIHDAIASEMQALFGGIQATGGEEATVRFSLMDGGVPSPPDASYMPTPTGRRPIANLGSPESADPRIADAYRIEKAPSGFHVSGRTFRALLYGMFGLHRILAVSGGAAAPYSDANPAAAAKHDAAAKPSAAANPVAAAAPDAAVKHDAVAANPFAFPHESAPRHPIRMLNHWDNFDGSIERGYAGDSIFFDRNAFRGDLGLLRGYARLLASVGINAVSINNVNVHRAETAFITGAALPEIKKIADVFASYGISTYLSVNFAAPITLGGLDSADPLDGRVRRFWEEAIAGIYRQIPHFGGFVVKADSEGEPGPFTYGRSHDDGANMLADAIRPFGGIIIWRCFVYNCEQDWRDRTLDRAKAAYDIFMGLDGHFADNVALQIKNGPIDFQIREPHSPLFGALRKTNQILEFQITQEYTGQQKHVCYLVPMWKETLDFDTGHGDGPKAGPGVASAASPASAGNGASAAPVWAAPQISDGGAMAPTEVVPPAGVGAAMQAPAQVKHLLGANSPRPALSGVAGVVNVGMDANWTGNKLAQANLYGYGRLAWDDGLSSEAIAAEWVALSFSLDADAAAKVVRILATSRQAFENYTCPLGVGFMCKPGHHYGVDVDGYEYDRWGTYHYADREGVGRDRTLATGTAYTRQYADGRFAQYEDLSTCPDEVLLFFHHVPYTHVLRSGKTVIQHIYDSHFDGVAQVEAYRADWESLRGLLDEESFSNVAGRLEEQLRGAIDWRDQVNTYFYRKSGIPDAHGRVVYP